MLFELGRRKAEVWDLASMNFLKKIEIEEYMKH
jgi:hypothetical protein